MSVNIIITQILVIFILTLLGVIAKKYDIIEEKAESSLANIVLYITVPLLVFCSVISDIGLDKMLQGGVIPVLGIGLIIVMMGIAFLIGKLVKVRGKTLGTFMVLSSMPNSGFLGFPVVYSIFGQQGLTYAVLYDIGVTVIFFSLAVVVLKGSVDIRFNWKTFLNPPIVAFLLGLLVKIFHIDIPAVFLESFRIMGNSTVPLAMLLMGVNLSKIQFKKNVLNVKDLLLISIIKLLAFPVITYIILLVINLNPLIKSVIVLESAMPSMVSTPILVKKYGGNMNLTTTAIFVTTILALLTIPLIFYYFI